MDDLVEQLDGLVEQYGFNTRVIAFVSDPDKYRAEINALTKVAEKLAPRINLRVAILDD